MSTEIEPVIEKLPPKQKSRTRWVHTSVLLNVVKNQPANAGYEVSVSRLERSLEKEMATYISIFAWKIPWTEELGGLQSMRSQKSDMT